MCFLFGCASSSCWNVYLNLTWMWILMLFWIVIIISFAFSPFFGCVSQFCLVVHPHFIWISILNLFACASLSHLDMYTHFVSLFGVHPHPIWKCILISLQYVSLLYATSPYLGMYPHHISLSYLVCILNIFGSVSSSHFNRYLSYLDMHFHLISICIFLI